MGMPNRDMLEEAMVPPQKPRRAAAYSGPDYELTPDGRRRVPDALNDNEVQQAKDLRDQRGIPLPQAMQIVARRGVQQRMDRSMKERAATPQFQQQQRAQNSQIRNEAKYGVGAPDAGGFELGPGSEVPQQLGASQEQEDADRRKRRSTNFSAQAAQKRAELNRWKENGREAPPEVRAAMEAEIAALEKQAEEAQVQDVRPMPKQIPGERRPDFTMPVYGTLPGNKDRVEQTDRNMHPRQIEAFAKRIIAANSRSDSNSLSPEEVAHIQDIVQQTYDETMEPQEAIAQLRKLSKRYEVGRVAQGTRAQAARATVQNLARMNPAERMAMYQRQLASPGMSAADRAAVAAAHNQMSTAAQFTQQHIAERQAAAMERAAQLTAESKDPVKVAERTQEALRRGVAGPDAEVTVPMLIAREGEDPAVTQRRAEEMIARERARSNPNDPVVLNHLARLMQMGEQQFVNWTIANMGWTHDQAVQEYDRRSSHLGWLWNQIRRAAGGGSVSPTPGTKPATPPNPTGGAI